MRLGEVRKYIKNSVVRGPEDLEIRVITCDSREINGPGPVLFAAAAGSRLDGNAFIEDAVKRGARCIMAERPTGLAAKPGGPAEIIVPDVREAVALLSAHLYGRPSESMTLVGVTGTNGKTTVTYLLESIFSAAGHRTGVIGTVNYRFSGRARSATHTTPGAPELQRILKAMKDSGVTCCAMEVSSHALVQKRVFGCQFDGAVFTNLSHDHLDYHRTMEEYFAAKTALFGLVNDGPAVINTDDPWGRKLSGEVGRIVSYGLEDADVTPLGKKIGKGGIEALLSTPRGMVAVSSPLTGAYNLLNILAAAAAALSLGVDPRAVERGISALERVPGRLERVTPEGHPFSAYVDYAHTPDALKRAITAVSEITEGRVITVFGCGGDRDRKKRPVMGRAATDLSDVAIITSDNPRSEDPLGIIKEIEAGVRDAARFDPGSAPEGDRLYTVVPDRARAIRLAVRLAGEGDAVLVAGKGHEDYQITGSERIHFDDAEVLREAIGEVAKA